MVATCRYACRDRPGRPYQPVRISHRQLARPACIASCNNGKQRITFGGGCRGSASARPSCRGGRPDIPHADVSPMMTTMFGRWPPQRVPAPLVAVALVLGLSVRRPRRRSGDERTAAQQRSRRFNPAVVGSVPPRALEPYR
jgi:hypothetical protein